MRASAIQSCLCHCYYVLLIVLDVSWALLDVTNGVKRSMCFMSLNPLSKLMLRYYDPYPHFIDEQTLSLGVVMALGQGVSIHKWQVSIPAQSFLAPESLLVTTFNMPASLLVRH